MHTFTDTQGRPWTITLNVDAIRRVRSVLNINLLEAIEGRLLERLITDPVLLCDILFVVIQPEAVTKGISDEDFGRAMAGDAIHAATTSFLEELVARMRARLALVADTPKRELALADVVLDLDARVVRRGETEIELTAHEFNVLAYLRERAGRALTRAQIGESALPAGGFRSDRTIDSHVSRIRKKLGEPAAGRIRSVWGIGYRCEEESA